ncbi:hypothetical protein KAR91_75115 [Candidatus Pacearchaeota archaeon]|nr:hypothetical protein [Candidatus Pacearchaeota archaeon]
MLNRKHRAQNRAILTLQRNGYEWKYYSSVFGAVMAKRHLGITKHVEIDEYGLCNGLTIDDYLQMEMEAGPEKEVIS